MKYDALPEKVKQAALTDPDAINDYEVLRHNGVSEADAAEAVQPDPYLGRAQQGGMVRAQLPAEVVARLRPGEDHGPVSAEDIRLLKEVQLHGNVHGTGLTAADYGAFAAASYNIQEDGTGGFVVATDDGKYRVTTTDSGEVKYFKQPGFFGRLFGAAEVEVDGGSVLGALKIPAGYTVRAVKTDENGFNGVTFANDHTRQVVVALAGTNDFRDVFYSDRQLAMSAIPEQYRLAEQLVLSADDIYGQKSSQITVVGHSLGGALTSLVSAVQGTKGVTFNPAGVASILQNSSLRALDISADAGAYSDQIINYQAFADIVSHSPVTNDLLGSRFYVSTDTLPVAHPTVGWMAYSVQQHLLAPMLTSLERQFGVVPMITPRGLVPGGG